MDTPETDKAERMAYAGEYMVPTEVARKLEQERDEARTERDILKIIDPAWPVYIQQLERERNEAREAFKIAYNERVKVELERDEARAELAEWTDSAKNVRKEYDDEHHCSCVPILRKLLKDAERERDEARLDKRGG
jgi:hypothetical protein